MIRKALYFTNKQVDFLNRLTNLTFSEHTRRALDEYIERLQGINVSASQSKRGDSNE